MVEYTVFYDYLDANGWGECTSMHRSPHRLAPEAVALGVVVQVPQKPRQDGWNVTGWVSPSTAAFEWRLTRDPSYRVPASEFMSMLPPSARVAARGKRNTDAALADFFLLLEMSSAERRGINPHGKAARQGMAYLVSQGMMTQAEADAISDAANDIT